MQDRRTSHSPEQKHDTVPEEIVIPPSYTLPTITHGNSTHVVTNHDNSSDDVEKKSKKRKRKRSAKTRKSSKPARETSDGYTGRLFSPKRQKKDIESKKSPFDYLNSQIDSEFVTDLQGILLECFWGCYFIASGRHQEKSTTTANDNIGNALTAGTLLPWAGTTSAGLAIIHKALTGLTQTISDHSNIEHAKKIENLVPNHIYKQHVSKKLAFYIACIYCEQLKELSSNGKKEFCNYVTQHIIHYIVSDMGKNSTMLQKAFNTVGEFAGILYANLKSMFKTSASAATPEPKEEHPAVTMLNGLLFFIPSQTRDTKLTMKDKTKFGNEFYVEGILWRSGIKTEVGVTYTGDNFDINKYGYRYLPKKVVEALIEHKLAIRPEHTEIAKTESWCNII